jgi:hypothetical protein
MNNMAGAVRRERTLRREVPSTASAPREADDSVLVKTVHEREDAHRTRQAGNRDEVEGVVANTLNGACGKQSDMDGQAEGRVSGSE